jgi:hypothetical protein
MHKHWEHRILPNKHIINPAVNMTVVACGGVNVVVSACDTRMATEQPEFDVIEYQHLILAWMQVHRRLGPARDKSATRVARCSRCFCNTILASLPLRSLRPGVQHRPRFGRNSALSARNKSCSAAETCPCSASAPATV